MSQHSERRPAARQRIAGSRRRVNAPELAAFPWGGLVGDCAAIVLLLLSRAPKHSLSSAQLGRKMAVSSRTIGCALVTLVRSGLVKVGSARRTYVLARSPEDMTLADIIDSMERADMPAHKNLSPDGDSIQTLHGQRAWRRIEAAIYSTLSTITLAHMASLSVEECDTQRTLN
jgi:DNA-binding IscR family transcriptional regulator